ncbi:SRPBCC family protein [Streptomyces sp. MAR4 CNX-425]|uniref:SRPBCC family protein n=1 Tax=Streptomyces sp. MAR4 CNX-425 TaxID=3406343 RepID=UPI003B503B42
MAPSRFRFRAVWDLPGAPPSVVYGILADPAAYPSWWPQVRRVVPLDDRSGTAVFRSVLPYELRVTARAVRQDPAAGVLRIEMTGDLTGWARWTVSARPGGTRAVFAQRVDLTRPSLRLLALPGRPFFAANHAWMMRSGRRGLLALLRQRV